MSVVTVLLVMSASSSELMESLSDDSLSWSWWSLLLLSDFDSLTPAIIVRAGGELAEVLDDKR